MKDIRNLFAVWREYGIGSNTDPRSTPYLNV